MGNGYTAIMYDAAEIETALGDIGACRYDGAEIGLAKVREIGAENVQQWLAETDLDLYCVMGVWMKSEDAIAGMIEDMPMIAELGAEFVGFLPPQRGQEDEATIERWLRELSDAAVTAGLRPVVHHHGATAIEQPDEIRHYLDAVDDLELLFDTAHYYPYGESFPEGDITGGIKRFADELAYVHLKDVDPVKDFAANRDALTDGDFHLDNVINYFRSFTDLGGGIVDFDDVHETLTAVGYDGHYTIEIENQTEKRLVHAKENIDYWRQITSSD